MKRVFIDEQKRVYIHAHDGAVYRMSRRPPL
jgi:hypothetical protein